ncbi:hypothetical protein C8J57DRAFT_1502132 [Mycena rebaudengoi]|nr:hypothetical protein C8J57DRAFT_1502132 [Mycena rebaudengoi]
MQSITTTTRPQDDATPHAFHGHLRSGAAQREAAALACARQRQSGPRIPMSTRMRTRTTTAPCGAGSSPLCSSSVLRGLLAVSCVVSGIHASAGAGGVGEGLLSGLVHRAVGDGPTGPESPDTQSDFTKRKWCLIVIFVGLLVVLIFGVMLSAWCCKGHSRTHVAAHATYARAVAV